MSRPRPLASARRPQPMGVSTTAVVEVEVDVDPEDLEDAGWVYVGVGAQLSGNPDQIRRAHDAEHDGPFRWCQSLFCRDLARAEHTP